jgi:hypothetical protein
MVNSTNPPYYLDPAVWGEFLDENDKELQEEEKEYGWTLKTFVSAFNDSRKTFSEYAKLTEDIIDKESALTLYNEVITADLQEIEGHIPNSIKKAITYIIQPNIPEEGISTRQLKKIYTKTMRSKLDMLATHLGVTLLSHHLHIYPSKTQQYDSNKQEIEENFASFQYAMHALGEKRVDYDGKERISSFLEKNFYYIQVDNDERQANDLIVYLDEDKEPLHFGVFSDRRTVQSQWGTCPQIFSHPIGINPYGNSFIVFRKGKKQVDDLCKILDVFLKTEGISSSMNEEFKKKIDLLTSELGIKVTSHCFCTDPDFRCFEYALHILGEEQVRYDWNKDEITSFMKEEFNYIQIPNSERQKNDLIVYVDAKKTPTHFGVFIDPHTVQSKWGKRPQIFSHPIFTSPYGTSFIVFRQARSCA